MRQTHSKMHWHNVVTIDTIFFKILKGWGFQMSRINRLKSLNQPRLSADFLWNAYTIAV